VSENLNLLAELEVMQRAAANDEYVEPSQAVKDFVADLIHKEKTAGLSSNETAVLDQLMKLEHRMRLLKARMRLSGVE